MTAYAVVFTAAHEVAFQEITCPDPGPGDVVVRVTHSWISNGTEGSYLRGERSDGDTPFREGDPAPFPVVAGYQKIGVVEWVGAEVDDLAVGETVFATIGKVEGMHHDYGGHVSPSVCPRREVFKLPPGPAPLAFAGLVLAQVGYNGGMRPPVAPGDAAVVVGDDVLGPAQDRTVVGQRLRIAVDQGDVLAAVNGDRVAEGRELAVLGRQHGLGLADHMGLDPAAVLAVDETLLAHNKGTTKRLIGQSAPLTGAQLDQDFDLGLRTVRSPASASTFMPAIASLPSSAVVGCDKSTAMNFSASCFSIHSRMRRSFTLLA